MSFPQRPPGYTEWSPEWRAIHDVLRTSSVIENRGAAFKRKCLSACERAASQPTTERSIVHFRFANEPSRLSWWISEPGDDRETLIASRLKGFVIAWYAMAAHKCGHALDLRVLFISPNAARNAVSKAVETLRDAGFSKLATAFDAISFERGHGVYAPRRDLEIELLR
jgi:hypothetical protein